MSADNVPEGDYIRQERTCRYGHGPLQLLPSVYALNKVIRMLPDAAIQANDGVSFGAEVFTCGVGLCSTCGYVELFDKVVK